MIRQTAIALVLAATAALTPASATAETPATASHLHMPASQDGRVSVNLYNNGITASDVLVDGKVYTLDAHHVLTIKAPVGTVVYAQKNVASHRQGDALLTMKPELQNRYQSIN